MEKLINVNEISLNFNLREPKGNKCTNVYAVVKCGNVQMKIPTGCKVNSWSWNRKQQVPTITHTMTEDERENNTKVINIINQIRFGYLEYYLYLCNGSRMAKESEVKETIANIIKETDNKDMANIQNLQKGKSVKATTLLKKAFAVYYSEINPNAKESTKKMEENKLNAFFKYCEEIGKDAKSMLSQKGLNDYKAYLVNIAKEKQEKGENVYNSNQVINNKCQAVAKFINSVMVSHNDFIKYDIQSVKYQKLPTSKPQGEDKKRRPLTNEELEKLNNNDIILTEEEKEYRDLFVLECNCAYRISDTPKLFDKSQQKLYKKGDYELILINTQKENIDAVILITPIVKDILNKYENGFKFADPNDERYNEKLNKVIRRVAKKCGLNSMETYTDQHNQQQTKPLYEILGSHFARYTFINNALKLGLTPNEIKNFTGHKDDKMINEVYSIITKDDKVENALKAIERISATYTKETNSEGDKVREYKDVLAFYGEPYKNYKDITDNEELLRMIVAKYEIPLKEKGYNTKILKQIYNSRDAESRKRYEELLKVLDEISATMAAE